MSKVAESTIENLRSKIQAIKFGISTNTGNDQKLSSRPITLQALDDDGTRWFFTSDETQLLKELHTYPKVNVSFANPSDNIYVTAEGEAEVVKDYEKANELRNPILKVWFAQGLDDPNLSLIKVKIHYAEYWDSASNKMLQLFALAKAAITGEKSDDLGEHHKVIL